MKEKSKHYAAVEEFMVRAGQEVPRMPGIPSEEVRKLRARLIFEEAMETITALGFRVVIPPISSMLTARDPVNILGVCQIEAYGAPDFIEIIDGCCDIKVVTTGTLIACGISDCGPQKLIDDSNLAKFTGDAHKHPETGKWIKPSDWEAPNLSAEVHRQRVQKDSDQNDTLAKRLDK